MMNPELSLRSNFGLKLANAFGVTLKQQLQPELNVARVAGGGDPAEGRGAEEVVRQIEVWMVEEVEGLGPELQIHALREMCVLHERRIHTLKSRTLDNIPSGIAERPRSRERKSRSVEPLRRSPIRQFRLAYQVWTIFCAEAENRSSGAAVVDLRKQRHRERPSGLKRDKTERFPPVYKLPGESFSMSERQCVRITGR